MREVGEIVVPEDDFVLKYVVVDVDITRWFDGDLIVNYTFPTFFKDKKFDFILKLIEIMVKQK